MSEYTVHFIQTASAAITRVEAEDTDDAIEKAWDRLPGPLCHQCARDVELAGEWEPECVTDSDGETVWKEKRS